MSNLDDLRQDPHRDRATSSVFPSSAYYQSPENMYDIVTPRGRELLDEVYPSSGRRGEIVQSGWLILCIAAFILFVLLN